MVLAYSSFNNLAFAARSASSCANLSDWSSALPPPLASSSAFAVSSFAFVNSSCFLTCSSLIAKASSLISTTSLSSAKPSSCKSCTVLLKFSTSATVPAISFLIFSKNSAVLGSVILYSLLPITCTSEPPLL